MDRGFRRRSHSPRLSRFPAAKPAAPRPIIPTVQGLGWGSWPTRSSRAPCPPPLAEFALCRQTPEVGDVCGNSARTDLCGGRAAMRVPTALSLPRKEELLFNLVGNGCRPALLLRPSRVRKNRDLAACPSFETRPKRPLLRIRPSFANTYLTLRKPPPGPRFARPEDKLRGCLEGCSHGEREFFCTLLGTSSRRARACPVSDRFLSGKTWTRKLPSKTSDRTNRSAADRRDRRDKSIYYFDLAGCCARLGIR